MYKSNNRDRSKSIHWLIATENPTAQSLPFHLLEAGHFLAGHNYFQELSVQKSHGYIIFAISGNGGVISGNKEISVKENSVIVLGGDHRYAIKNDSHTAWGFKWMHLEGSGLEIYIPYINNHGGIQSINLCEEAEVEKQIDYLTEQIPFSDLHTLVTISERLTSLMSRLIICSHDSVNCKNYLRHQQIIILAINYIQQNYNQQITIDNLTGIVDMSKYYFLKLFKQYIGLSPYDYILNYRINQAKKLLRTTSYSVGEIGTMVGFTYESNFIKQFKRLTGMTPMSYRR